MLMKHLKGIRVPGFHVELSMIARAGVRRASNLLAHPKVPVCVVLGRSARAQSRGGGQRCAGRGATEVLAEALSCLAVLEICDLAIWERRVM